MTKKNYTKKVSQPSSSERFPSGKKRAQIHPHAKQRTMRQANQFPLTWIPVELSWPHCSQNLLPFALQVSAYNTMQCFKFVVFHVLLLEWFGRNYFFLFGVETQLKCMKQYVNVSFNSNLKTIGIWVVIGKWNKFTLICLEKVYETGEANYWTIFFYNHGFLISTEFIQSTPPTSRLNNNTARINI